MVFSVDMSDVRYIRGSPLSVLTCTLSICRWRGRDVVCCVDASGVRLLLPVLTIIMSSFLCHVFFRAQGPLHENKKVLKK